VSSFDLRIEWHSPDQHWVAVFLRDGEPWFLNGAMVGFGVEPGDAVADLMGIARHLVIHGENFLTDAPLGLDDRKWLFSKIELADRAYTDEMYLAIRQAEAAPG
jgi:hypothetical protein